MELRPGFKKTDVGLIPEDWDVVSVGNLADFTSGKGISIAALHGQSSDFPVPVFGGNGIAGYTTTALVRGPSVVVGRVGQKCGEVYLVDGPAWITDNALYPRSISRPLDVRFLALALEAAGLNNVKNRNDLPLVTQSILQAVRIAWPPAVPEQHAIAGALGDLDALLAALTRLIAKKRDLKQAAMQQLLTGQTRLPGFKGEWKVKRLGDVAEIVSGGTPRTSIPSYWDGGVKWCTPTDITGTAGKYLSETERTISQAGLDSCSAQLLPAGTLLLCSRATIGELKIAGCEVCTNQGFKSLIARKDVNNEYLYYLLQTMKPRMVEKAIGSTFLEISKKDTASLEVSLPAFNEQVAIAAVLSDMDAELAALERRLAKTRAVKQGMMQELLTGRTRLV